MNTQYSHDIHVKIGLYNNLIHIMLFLTNLSIFSSGFTGNTVES